MELREAARQAIDALELGCTDHDGNPVDLVGPAITALRAALSNTQDWDEIDALRASLREHMAEIHRLRAAGRQALEALEEYQAKGAPFMSCDAAVESLRTALAEDRSADTGKTSDHIPDAGKMVASVREDRTVEAIIKQSLIVEPVAYVTGYFDGKCVIKPIEPVVLPTGMALYRSPLNQSEDALGMVEPVVTLNEIEIVEPVGYGVFEDGNLHDSFRLEHEAKLFAALKGEHAEVLALYTAPPKREPLTDEQIQECVGKVDDARLSGPITEFARAIERAIWEKNGG